MNTHDKIELPEHDCLYESTNEQGYIDLEPAYRKSTVLRLLEADRKQRFENGEALKRYKECGADEEQDPIERLRFFCSLAMSGQDWLDSEQFFEDLIADRKRRGEPVGYRWRDGNEDTWKYVDGLPPEDSIGHYEVELLYARAANKPAEPDKQHPDDVAVDAFAAAMKAKLKRAREVKGRGGWQDMSATELSAMLREHVEKGDPVDVANLAMMLHQNGQGITPAEPDVLPGEAVFGFAAWLTSLKVPVTFSECHGAAVGADLAAAYNASQGFDQVREDYHKRLTPYPKDEPPQPAEPVKSHLKVSYDDKGDCLYVVCDSNEPADAEEDDKGILYRRAISDGRLVGITIMNFMGQYAKWSDDVQRPAEPVKVPSDADAKHIQDFIACDGMGAVIVEGPQYSAVVRALLARYGKGTP